MKAFTSSIKLAIIGLVCFVSQMNAAFILVQQQRSVLANTALPDNKLCLEDETGAAFFTYTCSVASVAPTGSSAAAVSQDSLVTPGELSGQFLASSEAVNVTDWALAVAGTDYTITFSLSATETYRIIATSLLASTGEGLAGTTLYLRNLAGGNVFLYENVAGVSSTVVLSPGNYEFSAQTSTSASALLSFSTPTAEASLDFRFYQVEQVPEPATFVPALAAMAALVCKRRRRSA